MKVVVSKGVLWKDNDEHKENMIDCPMADSIANRNGLMCAEQVVSKFAGKTIHIDDETLKIKEIEEDFLP